MGQTGALCTVHTKGTDNHSNRDTMGRCLLYIQRALATSHLGTEGTDNQTGKGRTKWGAHSGALSTVHNEGTDNQSDRCTLGHCLLNIQRELATSQTGEHWGTVY